MSVIRVYATEKNARGGGSTGLIGDSDSNGTIDTLTLSGTNFVSGVHNSDNDLPYFIYEKYFYRIEANEPVLEFHIDWDDGEDNSRDKRNVQVLKFKDPVDFCVVDHVYTTSGPKFPLIRVKSMDGFLSKWYVHNQHNYLLNESLSAYVSELGANFQLHIGTVGSNQGQQDFLKVSVDKNNSGGVPMFSPQNVPPICIMKSDKKRIFAGVANHILQQNFESGTQYALLYAFSDTPASFTGTLPKIKLTVETDDTHVNEYTIDPSNIVTINMLTGNANNFTNDSDDSDGQVGVSRHLATDQMPTMMVPFGNHNKSQGGGTNEARRLLRAEIVETNDFPDDRRIYIHVLNVGATYTRSNVDVDENRTLCILSNGNPIVDSLDPMYSANVDASESYNRSSGNHDQFGSVTHGIAKYLIDDDTLGDYNSRAGKVFSGSALNYPTSFKSIQDASEENSGATAVRDPTDILKGTELSFFDRGTNPTLNVSYTHGSHGHYKDEDGRFLDYYRLIRGQVRGTETKASDLELAGGNYSQVSNHKRNLYSSTVDSGVVRTPSQYGTNALIMFSNSDTYTNANQNSGTPVTGIADAAWRNIGGTVATSLQHMITSYSSIGANNQSSTVKLQDGLISTADSNTTKQPPHNYLLICQPDKFDRVHFRTNNYNLVRDAVGGSFQNDDDCFTAKLDNNFTAWYMGPDGWKTLEITDRTNGLSNSGSISFKRPADWTLATQAAWGTTGPVDKDNTSGAGDGNAVDPATLWDFNAYAILIGIDVHTPDSKIQVTNIWPFSNEHSQYIKVVDPHHVSLNSIAIAQSISFNRQGKFQTITDRFGKSEIRKMGVNGGKITFGSVDLGDTDLQGNRKKMKRYQQNATPVFLDVTHKSGEKTRFFGVISQMSEDHPTGKQNPKYAITMQVSHLIEMSSTGTLLSDKISIGGNSDGARQYRTST